MSWDKPTGQDWEIGDCSDLFRHTVPIFDYDQKRPSLIGTGVLIALNQHRFVITAAHVLEPGIRNVAFGFLGENGFEIFGADDMIILTARAQFGGGNPQLAVYKDDLDLTVIQLTREVMERLRANYRPYDLTHRQQTLVASWGVISGWPARKNTYNPKTRTCEFETCYHIQCPILGRERAAEVGWNSDIHLAVSADKKKDFVSLVSGGRVHLPNLEGMSGSGMWIRSSSDRSWLLTGVVVEDHPSKRMLKVIKIEHLWTPLRMWLDTPNLLLTFE